MNESKQEIQNLKNFVLLNQSFKKWLTTCPKEYIWEITKVTKDHSVFTFSLIKERNESEKIDLEIILSRGKKSYES
tara:strand:+ start:142 stop:369 length:228 start_codon:yes stop_codon:yes gene_type:complete